MKLDQKGVSKFFYSFSQSKEKRGGTRKRLPLLQHATKDNIITCKANWLIGWDLWKAKHVFLFFRSQALKRRLQKEPRCYFSGG